AALHRVPAPGWDGPDLLAAAMAEPDLAAIHAFWEPALPRLDDLLADAERLAGAMSASPPVFTHGDCHTENITHADGSLIFCDWQSARTGRPSSDLAFLSVRATPTGVTVPPALLDAYDPDRDDELRRAVVAEELAILIFQWPHFAAYNSATGIARIRARAADLAQRWLHGRGSPGYS
ncbi:phosphotransferase, partial [Actinoplanes sp. NPDC051633]|uniref:phosphotransferase family protein n=1 Tax=Actinoplanes sp. NPDC051633 TaxID=3155670 RepID=UPI00343ADF36